MRLQNNECKHIEVLGGAQREKRGLGGEGQERALSGVILNSRACGLRNEETE